MTTFPPIDLLPFEERERFFDGPAQRPPKGFTSRAGDTPNNNGIALGVTIVCVALTSTAVILRGYSQIVIKKQLAIEDGLGLLAFVAFCGITWTTVQLLEYKMFYNHQWDISVRHFVEILIALYIWPTLYTILMGFIKPAILLEWTKVFVPRGLRNKFWWICVFFIFFNMCVYIASFVAVQFYCTPHERISKRWVRGECINRKYVDSPSSVFNLFIDVLILLLPQRVIWHLQMTRLRKISISIIFGIGVMAVVLAAGRVYAIATLDYDDDVTFHAGPVYLWSMAECTCVMLVFCIPPIPRIFTKHGSFKRIGASLQRLRTPPLGISKEPLGSTDDGRCSLAEPEVCRGGKSGGKLVEDDAHDHLPNTGVPMARLQTVVYPSASCRPVRREGGYGIICTKSFSTEEHYRLDV